MGGGGDTGNGENSIFSSGGDVGVAGGGAGWLDCCRFLEIFWRALGRLLIHSPIYVHCQGGLPVSWCGKKRWLR